jgi:hypothetical protein
MRRSDSTVYRCRTGITVATAIAIFLIAAHALVYWAGSTKRLNFWRQKQAAVALFWKFIQK